MLWVELGTVLGAIAAPPPSIPPLKGEGGTKPRVQQTDKCPLLTG